MRPSLPPDSCLGQVALLTLGRDRAQSPRFSTLDVGGAPENNFHLIHDPQGFVPGSGGGAGQFKFGGVDMNYQPNAGATYVAFFVDPRTNVIFADSRKNFARSDLNATGGMYLPVASAAMIAAAGAAAPNQLHDFVLVIRRISDG